MIKIENRKAGFNYEILEKIEAGVILKGSEIKSLREGKASLKESFARVENGELFLFSFYVTPYPAALEKHDPLRKKKLLLKKEEIKRLSRKTEEKGLTIVPLSVYCNSRGFAKVRIALAKGKKLYDKRSDFKKKEVEREIERKLKNRR